MVTHRLIQRIALRLIAAGLAAAPLVVPAQQVQVSPSEANADWKSANETVGQSRRGHADVLKWEQANLPGETKPLTAVADLPLMTASAAVRRAWRVHRDLAQALDRLGADNLERIASGRWAELDPGLQRRIDDMDELLGVAAETRKLWLQALAARQVLKYQRDVLVAAEAASELGQRMASVGNWSRLQQSSLAIALKTAQMDLKRAQYEAARTEAELIGILQLSGVNSAVDLPDILPDLPLTVITHADVQQRLAKTMDVLPRANRLGTKANTKLAFDAYEASHAIALAYRDILKLREFVTDETVLHYNGMLKSVWDVLGEARNRSQAAVDAIGAQRDFWIAETDLQLVLQGSAPSSFVSLGGGSKGSAAPGH